jgi:hypothetical protein
MFRLVSLFGMVALTVAAAALANQSQKTRKEPRRENEDDAPPQLQKLPEVARLQFHARFSLN